MAAAAANCARSLLLFQLTLADPLLFTLQLVTDLTVVLVAAAVRTWLWQPRQRKLSYIHAAMLGLGWRWTSSLRFNQHGICDV